MRRVLALAPLLVVLASCGDDGISVYTVPRETARPPARPHGSADAARGPDAGMPVAAPSGGLAWTAGAGWVAQGASGMRVATFILPGKVELSVVTFPGDSGGLLPNVNRWRGQLGLPPVDEAGLAKTAARITCPAGAVTFVTFPAQNGKSALAGGILGAGGATWFFKATGGVGAVADAVPALKAFLATVRPAGGAR